MNKKIIGLTTLTLLCSSLPSFAGVYVGAGLGYFRIEDQDFLDEDNDLKDDRAAWKLYGGLDLGDIFSLEVSHVEFGDIKDEPLQLEADGETIAALLGFPIGDSRLYAKAGQLYWNADATIANTVNVSDDGNDTFYGIGARVGGDEGVGVKLEFEHYELGNADIDMPSISLNMEF
ncbi:MAG TPA: outer membrane beta-barrel protein [Gammaproteobacteria bacterium]|nr:outer membrane beta-barrel protein [Gammaproteobacteria bacterium]